MTRDPDDELPHAETLAEPASQRSPAVPLAHEATAAATPSGAVSIGRAELAAGAAIGTRYVVASVLGRGGMGTVYLARDQSLGRDVALKLHRAGSGHERLYREALAMAQLAHPNVVTVFEVGTLDDQLFVAMEYVRGATLRDWWTKQPRDWRAIVAILLDVGEGLAAAHRAGLVHRDFKPENVLVGEDGRPRVSDFGLARANAAIESHESQDSARGVGATLTPSTPSAPPIVTPISASGPMTETGALLGTPAYMAPEQYAGQDVDARSDQFSFCVAAWEALHGTRPFAGSTLPQLQQAIERGAIVRSTSNVPPRVLRVLERGLAARSADRWPDLPTLLAALRTAARPRSRRGIAIAAAAGALAIAGGLGAWWLARGREPSCDGAAPELDQQIAPQLRAHLVELAGAPGSEPGKRVQAALDDFARSYRADAVAACRAAGHHDWSADLEQRSHSCREEQAFTAGAWLRAVEGKFRGAELAWVIGELPAVVDLAACRDPNILAALPALPADQREAIESARGELIAISKAVVPRMFDVRAIARIAASSVAAMPAVSAALALARARIAEHSDELDTAIREATEAYYKAHAAADTPIEIDALHMLLDEIGTIKQDPAGVESWYRLAVSDVDRFGRTSPLRAAQLRLAIVPIAILHGDVKLASEQASRAVEVLERAGTPTGYGEALREQASVVATAGDSAKALELYALSRDKLAHRFGNNDLQIALLLGDEALALLEAGRKDDAIATAEHALTIVKRNDAHDLEAAGVELNVAAVFIQADRDDDAEPLLRSSRQIFASSFGENHPTLATIDSNLALIANDRGKHAEAVELLHHALAIQEKLLGPDHLDVAATLYNLAASLADRDAAGALAAARRALAIRETALPNSDLRVFTLTQVAKLENDTGDAEAALRDAKSALTLDAPHADYQATAWPKLEQARALVALHRDRETARKLLVEARAAYAKDKEELNRLVQIDALLAKL